MEEAYGADALCPAAAQADRVASGGEDVGELERRRVAEPEGRIAEPERRIAEQRVYRALVDYATGKREGPVERDGWAGALSELRASWRVLSEKYGYEQARPEPAPQASDAGSWSGNGGRRLDAARNAEIDAGYARIREVGENVIAPAILRIAAEDPGRSLAGFDRRIKGEERLKEKVVDRMRSKGRSAMNALAQISDVVRFTFTYGEAAYADGVLKDLERLEVSGFTQVERRNTWASDQYKGINTQWLEPQSGVRFEVQFHTRASLEAKELTHQAYEHIRTMTESTPAADREAAELRKFQQRACFGIPVPPGVSEIDNFPPGGH